MRDAKGTKRFPREEETEDQGTLEATAMRKPLLRKHRVGRAANYTVESETVIFKKTELLESDYLWSLWTYGHHNPERGHTALRRLPLGCCTFGRYSDICVISF